jgi:hypothetical protein
MVAHGALLWVDLYFPAVQPTHFPPTISNPAAHRHEGSLPLLKHLLVRYSQA